MDEAATVERSFDGWYRAEHPRLICLLTVAAGDADLACDLTDEAFTRALERWERVREMASPAAWTYQVGLNLLRRRARRAALEARLLRRAAEPPRPPAAVEPDLWAAVAALPARQRTAIALRYLCDLPQAEVAEVMGVAPGTVAATLNAARRRLAAALGDAHTDVARLEVRLD